MSKSFRLFSLLGVIILWASAVSADVIRCSFTEPFVTYSYNTSTAVLEVSGLGIETKSFGGVGLQVMAPNRLRLAWQDGVEQVLDLTVDYQGSDLMSDHVYPYSARYSGGQNAKQSRQGGCSSNHLRMIIPIDPAE